MRDFQIFLLAKGLKIKYLLEIYGFYYVVAIKKFIHFLFAFLYEYVMFNGKFRTSRIHFFILK